MLEISFDQTDCSDDFVRGCYRLHGSNWCVFQFIPAPFEFLRKPYVTPSPTRWITGVTGVSFQVPLSFDFQTDEMTRHLVDWLDAKSFQIIRGQESETLTNPVPDDCNVCGHDHFEIVGRVGHYDGKTSGGYIYAATCSNCDTHWTAKFGGDSTPWDIETDPWW